MTLAKTKTYKKNNTKAKKNTNTKFFTKSMYARFLESRGFKNLKYDIDMTSFDDKDKVT